MAKSFMDAVAEPVIVKTSKFGEIEVPGFSVTGIAQLLQRHPELIPMIQGEGFDGDTTRLFDLGAEVILSLLAVGLGCNPNDAGVRAKCNSLTPSDQIKILKEIIAISFPDGVKDFFEVVTDEVNQFVEALDQGSPLQDSVQSGHKKEVVKKAS